MMQFSKSLKTKISRNFINSIGWNTERKIVVFESDDWGSIRMPSLETYNYLFKKGAINENHPYTKYDTLESGEDLSKLFDELNGFKDQNGKHPQITANYILANPDFNRIKESDFRKYYYEDFIETLSHYPKHSGSLQIIYKAISENLFYPQNHGREHVHVPRWFDYLKNKDKNSLEAFSRQTFVFKPKNKLNSGKSILAAMDFDTADQSKNNDQIIKEGLNLFERIFGYKSLSFVAPNYIWDQSLEDVLHKYGVMYIQGTKLQNIPKPGSKAYNKKFRYTGHKSKSGLINIVRNCFFEPSTYGSDNIVESCLKQISNSFFWKKPAVISMHRLNFMGHIVPANRDNNLILLRKLLNKITTTWPEVEFLTTPQLGKIISDEK